MCKKLAEMTMSLSVQSQSCDINSDAPRSYISAYLLRRFLPADRDDVAFKLWMVKIR